MGLLAASPLSFHRNQLTVDGVTHLFDHVISSALDLGTRIVVLFDPAVSPNKQFENLITVHRDGEFCWRAPLPTSYVGDRYLRFCWTGALCADSAKSYRCLIDLGSGKILRRNFRRYER